MSTESTLRALRRSVTEAFTENLGLKAIAALVAIGLALGSRGQLERTQRTIPMPVVLRLPPDRDQRELMTPTPSKINVTVVGATRALDRLTEQALAPVELDLRDGRKESIQFDGRLFSLPPDVDLKYVDPPVLALEWQDVVTRTVPVQAPRTGQPARGHEVRGAPVVEPPSVTLRGPERLVEVIQHARVDPFDVSGLTEGVYRRRLAIDEPPPRVSIVEHATVTVTVTIGRRLSELRFPRRPIEVVGLPHARAVPQAVDVTVVGPPEVVALLRPEQVVPRVDPTAAGIDVQRARHGSAALRVRVDLAGAEAETQPPGVTVHW